MRPKVKKPARPRRWRTGIPNTYQVIAARDSGINATPLHEAVDLKSDSTFVATQWAMRVSGNIDNAAA